MLQLLLLLQAVAVVVAVAVPVAVVVAAAALVVAVAVVAVAVAGTVTGELSRVVPPGMGWLAELVSHWLLFWLERVVAMRSRCEWWAF